MTQNISETTGEEYYSGTAAEVGDVLRVLNIGTGKLDQLSYDTINRYQEMVDRAIDAELSECYYVPLRSFNQVRPMPDANGNPVTVRVFPGDVRKAARYWTAALVLQNEFQQLEANSTEQATSMLNGAREEIHAMRKPSHWIVGQRRRSNLSHTVDGHFQPAAAPEYNA